MGCWNYGGDAPDLDGATKEQDPGERRLYRATRSSRRFGTLRAGFMRGPALRQAYQAWLKFDGAFEYFPFDLFLIYYGPHMHGTGFEWVFTREEIPHAVVFQNRGIPSGNHSSPNGSGDWRPTQIIGLFDKLTARWGEGV